MTVRPAAVLALLTAISSGCDKVPLLAPTNSTITLSAAAIVLPLSGSTTLTAFVTESSGTPVQNGTTVRFTTTLGTVQPSEVQTVNGLAVTTFFAGTSSGVADIRAISGGPTSSSGSTTSPTSPSSVQITVGAAAVNTVTLRANPGSVGPSGGTVEIIALVIGEAGKALSGVPVTFSADQGTLSSQSVSTDAAGEARSELTTQQKTTVTATAGLKTSNSLVVDVRPGPALTVSCAPAVGSGGCTAIQADAGTNLATVVFTIAKASGSSNLRETVIDFGDGATQSLGSLSAGQITVAHSYGGPSSGTPRIYTATITATDVNGETGLVSLSVGVTQRPALAVELVVSLDAAVNGVGRTANFTATLASGEIQSVSWDFGDGHNTTTAGGKTSHVYTSNGQYTAAVTVTTTDGSTATGHVEFIISGV